MRTQKILLYGLLLFSCYSCKGQQKMSLRYVGHQYEETKNSSFINDKLIFLENKDSSFINLKLPFDRNNHQIIDRGIFYNCHLKEDTVYTIKLKKICLKDIPDVPNSYYKTNTVPDKKDCSKFVEVENNTAYRHEGNYGKYVDIDGTLYEITGLSPNDGCFLQN